MGRPFGPNFLGQGDPEVLSLALKDVSDQVHIDSLEAHDARWRQALHCARGRLGFPLSNGQGATQQERRSVENFLVKRWFPIFGPRER